jgi:integrase
VARTVRDAKIETREGRRKLLPRGKPYYRLIEQGEHLGYRKPKQGPGQWLARHYVGGPKDYEFTPIGHADDLSDADGVLIRSFKQAQDRARDVMVERARAKVPARPTPLTVAMAIEGYLDWLKENRKSGDDAEYRAQALIIPALGNIEVAALTTDEIQTWLSSLARAPARLRTRKGERQRHREPVEGDETKRRRRSSANRTLTILKAALNRAWRAGKVPSDDAWRRVKPFEGVDTARVRYLTTAEAKRLINAADPDFRNLVQAALLTGARYGELAQLQVCDFNRDSGTLAIRRSKTGRARHIVLTKDEGAQFFAALCAGRARHEVLLRKADGELWRKSNQAVPMASACKRAQIVPRIGFHGLRHTYASLSVMNGTPSLVVAKNLGHSDTRMVEKHYGHFAPSYVTEAIQKGAPRFGIDAAKVTAIR